MITFADMFNVEEFLADIFDESRTSFVIRDGGRPWEEADWGVGRGFKGKWWFLFS